MNRFFFYKNKMYLETLLFATIYKHTKLRILTFFLERFVMIRKKAKEKANLCAEESSWGGKNNPSAASGK